MISLDYRLNLFLINFIFVLVMKSHYNIVYKILKELKTNGEMHEYHSGIQDFSAY
jgi:hypothetical protein